MSINGHAFNGGGSSGSGSSSGLPVGSACGLINSSSNDWVSTLWNSESNQWNQSKGADSNPIFGDFDRPVAMVKAGTMGKAYITFYGSSLEITGVEVCIRFISGGAALADWNISTAPTQQDVKSTVTPVNSRNRFAHEIDLSSVTLSETSAVIIYFKINGTLTAARQVNFQFTLFS